MADFTASGIYGMPTTSLEALRGVDTLDGAAGDPRVLGWIREAVIEGDRINQSDPSYAKASVGMEYIVGEQKRNPGELKYLPQLVDNQSRKVTQAHASVLTDLKPVWGYKSSNPAYEQHGYLLDQLITAWYINTMADLELGSATKYSLAAGTADILVEWDPHARFGGDHRICARDFRDTLPWRPSPMSRDVQDWQGVIFREEHSVNVLRGMYPTKAHLFVPTPDSLLSTLMGRFRAMVSRVVSPAADTLAGLTSAASALKPKSGNVLLYRATLDDHTRNLTSSPIPMGPPGAAWAYVVKPGELLYPNKRSIIATPDAVVWDGPAPFWHGMLPFSRLMLWSVPWQFLGVPLLNDLIPLQDGINDNTNDLRLGIKQWMDPKTVFDRQAVSESFMRTYDARRPGAKIKTNPTFGDGFKNLDGPAPQVLALCLQFIQHLTDRFNDLSGVANLQALLQLRQMPGAETIRQYYEAMTPELRSEGRQMEAFVRPMAEMLKSNTFQFMSQARRVTMLGDAGLTLEDFDYDPGNLIPALEKGQPGYTPELDVSLPREQRAQFFHKLLVFRVAPNSLLAMNSSEQKLLRLQLAREGLLDFWTLMEALEIPNVGTPPAMPLPPIRPPDPQVVLASLAAGDGTFILDPMSGQIREVRVPATITERLLAQAMLGIGGAGAPAGAGAPGQSGAEGGRAPSAGAMPKAEQKTSESGGPRSTITESTK